MNQRDKDRSLLGDLRALGCVQPDAEATARAIERARGAVISTVARSSQHRRNIMSLRNVGAVAASLLAIALLTQWLVPSRATNGFAFAEMQERVEKVKSVQYIQTRTDWIKPIRKGSAETRRVMILGSHRMREEEIKTPAGDPPPKGQVAFAAPANAVTIQNMATGKIIALFPDEKGYSIPQEILGIDLNTDEIKKQKIEAAPNVDFYNQMRVFPADKSKQLPDRTIDDRPATGFQVVETAEGPRGNRTLTRTYWIDRETKLPIRIESSVRSADPMLADTDWVYTDFVFDAPLDEALFSTDPPAGYKDLAPAAK